jgi:tol-pal system protein YbgF
MNVLSASPASSAARAARRWSAWRMARRAVALLVWCGAATSASAGLFSDDDARKAILDLRARVDQIEQAGRSRADQLEQAGRAREAELLEQITQLKRSLLDLNTLIESLRGDLARQRGIDEQLARDVADLQRKQKDAQQGLDERLRRMEPQKVALDGREFMAEADETRQYGDAVALLRQGDFAAAAAAFTAFQRRWPASGYGPTALYWLGNAQYGKRDYRDAIASFKALMAAASDHPRVPEALLSIANCQIELKELKSARRTLDDILKTHPQSEAAQAARERIAALK